MSLTFDGLDYILKHRIKEYQQLHHYNLGLKPFSTLRNVSIMPKFTSLQLSCNE